MTPDRLREAIEMLDIPATHFARAIGVSDRAVRMWLAGDRPIPGPVNTIVHMILTHDECHAAFLEEILQ